jgi:hypothetical protein
MAIVHIEVDAENLNHMLKLLSAACGEQARSCTGSAAIVDELARLDRLFISRFGVAGAKVEFDGCITGRAGDARCLSKPTEKLLEVVAALGALNVSK